MNNNINNIDKLNVEGDLTVIAHFCNGDIKYNFPSLEGKVKWSEGNVFKSQSFPDSGGVIVAAFGTNDVQLLVNAFHDDFKDCGMTFLGIQKSGDNSLIHNWSMKSIF